MCNQLCSSWFRILSSSVSLWWNNAHTKAMGLEKQWTVSLHYAESILDDTALHLHKDFTSAVCHWGKIRQHQLHSRKMKTLKIWRHFILRIAFRIWIMQATRCKLSISWTVGLLPSAISSSQNSNTDCWEPAMGNLQGGDDLKNQGNRCVIVHKVLNLSGQSRKLVTQLPWNTPLPVKKSILNEKSLQLPKRGN